MINNRLDLIGQRFGKLVVVEYAGTKTYANGNKFSLWLCKCDCGGTKIAIGANLKRGTVTSCGCAVKEAAQNRNSRGNVKHGYHDERLYNVWKGMKSRCNNINNSVYHNYGGRGIRVCEEWDSDYCIFREWALNTGYDENAPRGECTLDRIDVNGNYCPENCRWVNQRVQANNRRYNVRIEYDGEVKTLSEWEEDTGLDRRLLYERIFTYCYDIDKAFTKPVVTFEHPEMASGRSRNRIVEYNGEKRTVAEWAKIYGMSPDTLWARLFQMKWDVETALTKPVASKRKHKGEID